MSSTQSENFAAVADAPPSPGVQLRRAREARGESIHEVAFALKLAPRQVEALEQDDFAALPGMAFVRGFLRNYARYLGLDAGPLLAAVQRMGGEGSPDLSPIRNADGDLPSGGGGRSGSFPAGAVVLVLLVLLGTGWYFDWFRTEPAASVETALEPAPNFAPAPVQPVEPPALMVPITTPESAPAVAGEGAEPGVAAEAGAPSPASPPPDGATPAQPAAPASAAAVDAAAVSAQPEPVEPAATPAVSAAGQLSFRFGGDSWVEVRDAAGAILYSGTNRAGSTRTVQGTAPFALVVGNSANVTLEHDGKPVDLAAHTRGSVARFTLR
ncbi:RodZ domain-containing protein [Thauera sp. JM12B12]|uniref:helix-turn-helix domain-containing protein n=1 Tax=Thauera sp. JM12B12 TaxID=3142262 RepID=UPI0031F3BF5C